MILVLTTADHRFTIDRYLAAWALPLVGKLQALAYPQALKRRVLPRGVYIFTDADRLSASGREAAAALWQRVRDSHGPAAVLNHPLQSLRRFDLLTALHAQGLNTFRIHRVHADPAAMRFPVFLRAEDDHRGNRTPLLKDRAALEAAMRELKTRGANFDDWVITEFCDTTDRAGHYRKYSAFRVGARIIPRHMFVGPSWSLKHSELVEPAYCREELEYLEANPHHDTLRRIFDIARIEYGRIDYGLLDGRVQTWEINTNPMLPWHGNRQETVRREAHRGFCDRLAAAWEEIDTLHPAPGAYLGETLGTLGRVGWELLRNAGVVRGHGFPPDQLPTLAGSGPAESPRE